MVSTKKILSSNWFQNNNTNKCFLSTESIYYNDFWRIMWHWSKGCWKFIILKYTVPIESLHTPSFLRYVKLLYFFPHINLHPTYHNDKAKKKKLIYHNFNFIANLLKSKHWKNDIAQVFIPLSQNIVKALWQQLQPQVFWIWCNKLCTSAFVVILPFFSLDHLKLSQVGWEPSVDSHLQVSPKMSDWFQVPALAGPLKDVHKVVLKTLLHCLGCVRRVIVMLEGELSAQSEVLSALNQVH